jgi:hypothetical protein
VSVTFSASSKDFSCLASAKFVITNNIHSFINLVKYLFTVKCCFFNDTKFLHMSLSILSIFANLYVIHAPSFSIRPFLFGCSLHSCSLWFPIFNYTDVGLITSYVLQSIFTGATTHCGFVFCSPLAGYSLLIHEVS